MLLALLLLLIGLVAGLARGGRVAGDPGIAPTLLHPSGAAS